MASLGSLNLPSSMDIALYLEQVQEVEPALMSPHGCAPEARHRMSLRAQAQPHSGTSQAHLWSRCWRWSQPWCLPTGVSLQPLMHSWRQTTLSLTGSCGCQTAQQHGPCT